MPEYTGKTNAAIRYFIDNPTATTHDCIRQLKGVSGRTARRARRYVLDNKIVGDGTITNCALPKILMFDIETLPIKAYTWDIGKVYLNPGNIIQDWCVLSWAARWLFDPYVESDVLSPEEAVMHDDTRILRGIWDLIDKSDIVCAHNGKYFDIRKLNARFIRSGFGPPMPYQVIDTFTESRKTFAFSSASLDYINKYLGNRRKIHTDFALWKACDRGEQDALDKMVEYNIGDVYALEEAYLILRPWIKSHPNVGAYVEAETTLCPTCGSDDLDMRGNDYYTQVGQYEAFRCCTCGAIGRLRKTLIDKGRRDVLGVSVAR